LQSTRKKERKKMAGRNHVTLMGNLVADAETRVTQTGRLVTSFRVAANERLFLNGDVKESVFFGNCVIWGKRGEALVKKECLLKGQPVYLEGRLNNRSWTDGEGVTRYATEIIVGSGGSEFQLLSRGPGRQSSPEEEIPPPPEVDDFSDPS
jgi:single-strand DNA-binding protein